MNETQERRHVLTDSEGGVDRGAACIIVGEYVLPLLQEGGGRRWLLLGASLPGLLLLQSGLQVALKEQERNDAVLHTSC